MPNHARAQKADDVGSAERERLVGFAFDIDDDRERQRDLVREVGELRRRGKRDGEHFAVESLNFVVDVSHLDEVRLTGDSGKMP